jgi:hypothetical protein
MAGHLPQTHTAGNDRNFVLKLFRCRISGPPRLLVKPTKHQAPTAAERQVDQASAADSGNAAERCGAGSGATARSAVPAPAPGANQFVWIPEAAWAKYGGVSGRHLVRPAERRSGKVLTPVSP